MKMSINIYIDGDILVYQSMWGANSIKDIKKKLDQTIASTMSELEGSTGKIAIKGSDNFRKEIYPEYKGHRKKELTEQEKEFFAYSYDYLQNGWGAIPANGMEADDLLAIWNTEEPGIIVSIDKDLLQVPGLHFNTRNKEYTNVTEDEGSLLLHTQVLMGDSVDNITGLKGIGKVKAAKVMKGIPASQHLSVVKSFWQKNFGRGWEDDLQLNMDLIYLKRSMDDRYDIRTGKRFVKTVRNNNREGLEVNTNVSSNDGVRVGTRNSISTNKEGSSKTTKETNSIGSIVADF
jgi:5'-3' exonuclease